MASRSLVVSLAALCFGALHGSAAQQAAPATPCDSACLQAAWTASEAARGQKNYVAAAADLLPVAVAGPLELGPAWYEAMYLRACDLALAGDRAGALTALRAAKGDGGVGGADQMLQDPAFASVHDDPAFVAIVSEAQSLERLWNQQPGQQHPYQPEMTDDDKVAALSTVWSEVRFNFAFFDRQPGLDWNALYLETLPKVRAARSTAEVYHVLIRFMAALHDGHSNVYPPDALTDVFYARPGLRTSLIDGAVVVTRLIDPALAAEGWRLGDVVLAVNGRPVQTYAAAEVEPEVSASTPQDRNVRVYGYQLFGGDAAQSLQVQVRTPGGQTVERTLRRLRAADAQKLPGRKDVAFAVRPDGVAVLTINEFEDDQGSALLLQHLAEARAAKGLVIDVRGNGGGNTDYKLLGMLAHGPIPGPLQRTREYRAVYRAWGMLPGWFDLPASSQDADAEHHLAVPVAVLTGPETYSAAEDFVAAFDAMHRGVTVGEATGGSTGQPLQFKLPGGGRARVCTKNDRAGDGRVFEGVGLVPDVQVGRTVADVQAGRDPVMERAAGALLHPVARP